MTQIGRKQPFYTNQIGFKATKSLISHKKDLYLKPFSPLFLKLNPIQTCTWFPIGWHDSLWYDNTLYRALNNQIMPKKARFCSQSANVSSISVLLSSASEKMRFSKKSVQGECKVKHAFTLLRCRLIYPYILYRSAFPEGGLQPVDGENHETKAVLLPL